MHIDIDYNGSFAICKVNGKNFNEYKHFDQVYALSAFMCTKEHYQREVKLGRIKGIKQETENNK